ncbi:FAD-dependent oxidoreductase [Qipengyuania marisflavi]|uniref:FAD-dependent oxidoreductase n=2 Tax=Qipengyuania marisflavi TaxID=2486356 RepID=A0A5S3P9N0_9SPHN|nr:FAD-dependent oxidoreductase [Qipengyuania marisflavi]
MQDENRDVIVVGGGPAGMMAGLLLARAGVRVTVLEKHSDFLRDFRGDTVHPSTLALFAQLGLLDALLEIEHSRIEQVSLHVAGRVMRIADLRGLPVPASFIAMMPQWDLPNFMAAKAARYPGFDLRMANEAVGVTLDGAGRVCGVRLADGNDLRARLVIAADGRRSVLRDDAQLPIEVLGAPMDVFWFRLNKPDPAMGGESFGALAAGKFLVLIDRQSYFQCAYVFRKGGAETVRAAGMAAFRAGLTGLVPQLAGSLAQLTDWDQVKLLDVALDRLTRWHRPGLLAIGDAAHAMSPIGGVGINIAVQDAVATANVLAAPLARGENVDPLLAEVQHRRWRAVTRMQAIQKFAQDRVIQPMLARRSPIRKPPLLVRIINAVPVLRKIPGRVIGLGFDRQVIESPNAYPEIRD